MSAWPAVNKRSDSWHSNDWREDDNPQDTAFCIVLRGDETTAWHVTGGVSYVHTMVMSVKRSSLQLRSADERTASADSVYLLRRFVFCYTMYYVMHYVTAVFAVEWL